ncbi:MAG: fimbrial protein [Lysobacteraceae bacterium]|nr:MAG: fimbrial protein [Xanthomonadaceae bacterium]
MARINLLPWRAERQKQRQKNFFMMLALSAVSGLGLWFMVNSYYNAQISGQMERNAFLDQEIKAVEAKIEEIKELENKKAKLLARKKVIEELQGNRSQMVHLFDSLVRTIPDGVILTTIKQEGQKLTLEGRSQSNARVSTYMRNFEASTWMAKPELSIIEAKGEDKGLPYAFTLSVTLTNPNDAKQKEQEAAKTATAAGTTTTSTLPTLTPAQPAAGQTPATSPGPTAPAVPAQPAKPDSTTAPTTAPAAGGAKS